MKAGHSTAIYQKLPQSSGNSFLIERFTSPQFETPWHFHEEYELVYCETGYGKKMIGNSFSSYQEGDMAFIGKNVPHLFVADPVFYKKKMTVKPSSIVLQFREEFLGAQFFRSPEMIEMKHLLARSSHGISITGETREQIKTILYQTLEADKITRLKYLIELFGLLVNSEELQTISISNIHKFSGIDSIKMNRVLEYAIAGYKDDITIAAAAKLANLSPAAFCRYFKSRTQKSFLGLIIEMRINEACKLLRETDRTMIDICHSSGFKNLSNFNRLFRKHVGMNPVSYRANN